MSSSSAAMSLDSTGGLSASAMVPFTQTWINTARGSTVTTEATLVGQVLNNGATNWVGYNSGEAYFLLQTSESGATQTTLADGQIFYVSEGSPPAGYLATGGLASGSQGASASGAAATGSSESSNSASAMASGSASTSMAASSSDNSGSGSGSGGSSSTSATASASASSSDNSGHRLTLSATLAVVCGLLAVIAL